MTEIEAMSDEELKAIILSAHDGGAWLVRQRVQSFSVEVRDALLVALGEVESDGEAVKRWLTNG